MIDLIFFTFFVGLFVCGFWAGKTFGSAKNMVKAAKKKVDSWFAD